jgi:hypothetical protein
MKPGRLAHRFVAAAAALTLVGCFGGGPHQATTPTPATTTGKQPTQSGSAPPARSGMTRAQLEQLRPGTPFGTVLQKFGLGDSKGASRAHPCVRYQLLPDHRVVELCFPEGRLASTRILPR